MAVVMWGLVLLTELLWFGLQVDRHQIVKPSEVHCREKFVTD